jgi:hypothetical protein
MPKYKVELRREEVLPQAVVVDVEANSPEEAKAKALDLAGSIDDMDWDSPDEPGTGEARVGTITGPDGEEIPLPEGSDSSLEYLVKIAVDDDTIQSIADYVQSPSFSVPPGDYNRLCARMVLALLEECERGRKEALDALTKALEEESTQDKPMEEV